LRIGGNIISTAACFGSAVGPGTQVLTAVACTSATAGILSTIKYAISPSGEDPAGNLSTGISSLSCIGLSVPDCWSLLLALFDTHVPDCKVNQRHYEKKCVGDDRVYWFNNCGGLQEVADHCEHACKYGECLPYHPYIDVTVNADTRCVVEGGTIFFHSMVTGGDYNTYVYEWDFAGEDISYLHNDTSTFGTAGEKTITLTVTDDTGNKGYGAINVTIGDCDDYIKTEIQVSDTCVDKGDTVSFSPIVTGATNPLSYVWNFGDGAYSTTESPARHFNNEKTYSVTLSVRDNEGRVAQAARTIIVGNCSNGEDPDCVDNDGVDYFATEGCGTQIDCDDNNIQVNPETAEICNDEVDNDCDDDVDCDDSDCENDSACSSCTDEDSDGY